MAESNKIFCEPCEHNGITTGATVWCSECCEGFCAECIKGHKLTKLLRNHHIITIEDHINKPDLHISRTCGRHSKPFDSFCPQHDELLCLRCVQLHHGSCDDLLRIEEVIKGVKTSTALADLDDQITVLLQNIARGLDSNTENKKSLDNQRELIKSTINDTRAKINKKLDEIQEKLLNQLEIIYNQTVLELDKIKDSLNENEKKVLALKTQLNGLKTHASDMQTFIGMKMLVKAVYSEKDDVSTNKGHFYHDIQLRINSSIDSVIKNLKEFGEIVLHNKSVDSTYMEPQNRQAQLDVVQVIDVTKACLEKTQTINLQRGKKYLSLQSCVILNNANMVFTDFFNKRLIIHGQNGKFIKEITVSKCPKYLTIVDQDEVAVSYPLVSHVDIINITTNKTMKLSCNSSNCHNAVYFHDGRFFIALSSEGIKEITRDGNLTKSFLSHVPSIFKIGVNAKHFYYTILGGKTIYCTDLDGNQIWEFSDDRFYRRDFATPFTVDGDGNVYAIGSNSAVVLGISFDGKNHAVLLNEADGLNQPNAIFFDQQNSRLLVCNENNGKAFVFYVKTK